MSDTEMGIGLPPEVEALLSIIESVAVHRAAGRVPCHLWKLPNAELESRLRPSKTAKALRAAFWSAVRGAMADGQRIKLAELSGRAGCTYQHAHELFTADPLFLAWIFQPVENFHQNVEPLLSDLCEKVSEISRLPLIDKRGRVISRNANLILRTVQVLAPILKK